MIMGGRGAQKTEQPRVRDERGGAGRIKKTENPLNLGFR